MAGRRWKNPKFRFIGGGVGVFVGDGETFYLIRGGGNLLELLERGKWRSKVSPRANYFTTKFSLTIKMKTLGAFSKTWNRNRIFRFLGRKTRAKFFCKFTSFVRRF